MGCLPFSPPNQMKYKIGLDRDDRIWYSILAPESERRWSVDAGVAELVDARDLKSCGSDPVPVRLRSPAPISRGRAAW